MKYLCLQHRVQVARSAEVAQQLWLGAFWQGQEAFLQQDWLVAERYFGAAFDIAKIRMNDVSRGQLSAFDEAQLVVSAEYFARVLSRLLRFNEADSVIQFVRHHLLRKLAHDNATEDKVAGLKHYLKSINATGSKISKESFSMRIKNLKFCSKPQALRRVH